MTIVHLKHLAEEKYCAIEVQGQEQLVRTSRLDAFSGRSNPYTSKLKVFADEDDAQSDTAKRVRALIAKGYVEFAPSPYPIPKQLMGFFATSNDVFAVRKMLEQGFAPGEREVIAFATGGSVDIVRELIGRGLSLPAQALVGAAMTGKNNMIELAVAAGLGIDVPGRDGDTPLMGAANKGKKATVVLLLKKGAKVATANEAGVTALGHAAAGGHDEVIDVLIAAGADLTAKDHAGRTALRIAFELSRTGLAVEREKQLETCRYLIDKGSPLDDGLRDELAIAGAVADGHRDPGSSAAALDTASDRP